MRTIPLEIFDGVDGLTRRTPVERIDSVLKQVYCADLDDEQLEPILARIAHNCAIPFVTIRKWLEGFEIMQRHGMLAA